MVTEKRQSNTPLKERLLKEFYRFTFFKAVNLLESLFPHKKPLGQTLTPSEEVVRFASKTGLSFPPSDISNMKHGDKEKPVDMEVAFMGLIGPSGVLPHWYNEQVMERMHHKDHSIRAFYDIFNHRLISLFYLAWKKNQLSVNYLPEEKDRISSYFNSLIGLSTPGLTELIALPEQSLVNYYSGLLSRQVPSTIAIEATVGYYTGASVNVQQFVERIVPISPGDQTQIGIANAQLGENTVCGSYVWECQTKFRINLGPLGYKDFQRFMPDGKKLRPTFSLVKYMVGIEFEFDISLILKRNEVPDCILSSEAPAAPVLGWSIWIKSPGMVYKDDPHVIFQEAAL